MIIKNITLKNIKSYVNETITLNGGINCILGLNGSGKSTIIESIGFGLFNYTKGSINRLLRYNTSKGVITITFIANDNREYVVERTIRPKSNFVRIIDAKTNTELYSGVSDVYSFIKKILKIKKQKQLPQLFSEIISVPQGQFVNAFLEKPAQRKENFDRLFNLHIYKDLGIRLKNIYNKLQNERVNDLKEKIANIDGQTISYENKKAKIKEIKKELETITTKLQKVINRLKTISKNKKKYEQIKEEISTTKNNLILFQEKQVNIEKLLEKDQETLNQVKKAQEIVNKNKEGYVEFTKNQAKLKKLEIRYQRFLEDEKIIKNLEREYSLLINKRNQLEERINEKEKEIDKKQKEMQKINSELFLLNNRLNNMQTIYITHEQNFNNQINKFNQEKKEYNSKYQQFQKLKAKFDTITNLDSENVLNYNKQIIKLKNMLINYEKIKKMLMQLQKEKAINEENIKNVLKNSQISVDGNCPFFNSKCKNIDEQSLIEYFDKKLEILNCKQNEINSKIENLSQKIVDEQNIFMQIKELEKKIEKYNNDQTIITEINTILSKDYNIESKENLKKKMEFVEEKLNLEEKKLNTFESKINNEKNELFEYRMKIDKYQYQIKTKKELYAQYEKEVEVIKKIINKSNNYKITINNNVNEIKEQINKYKDKLNENDVKEKIEELKLINDHLENSKNKYLENINKANEKNILLEQMDDYQKQLSTLKIKEEELRLKLDYLYQKYSNEKYSSLCNEENNLIVEASAKKTIISEKEKQRKELFNEINKMEDLIKSKEEMQVELNRYLNIIYFLKIVRSICISLPEKLSTRYRQFISNAATQIYRKISGENIILEIMDDYEVRLIDSNNNFKTINQLSGGEQMSCALAIRLSMLKHLSGLDIYFLDEPTINLDFKRRQQVANIVLDVSKELSQLFVVSHDDTFYNITNAIIKLRKQNNISKLV